MLAAPPGAPAHTPQEPLLLPPQAYLLEINRCPGLQSTRQNTVQEDAVYDRMMSDLIRLCVLPPLRGDPQEEEAATTGRDVEGCWERVPLEAAEEDCWAEIDPEGKHKNVLRWSLYLKRCQTQKGSVRR